MRFFLSSFLFCGLSQAYICTLIHVTEDKFWFSFMAHGIFHNTLVTHCSRTIKKMTCQHPQITSSILLGIYSQQGFFIGHQVPDEFFYNGYQQKNTSDSCELNNNFITFYLFQYTHVSLKMQS